MSRLFWLKVITVLACALLALPQAMPAFACTPPPGGLPNYTAADRTKVAPLVLEGTVIVVSVETTQVGVVQVTRYFKGIGPQLIAIDNYGSSSVCRSEVSQGFQGIFYVSGDEVAGYHAYYLSQFDAIAPNDAQTVAEVIAASGQEPRTDFTPYRIGTPDAILTQVGPVLLPTETPTPPSGLLPAQAMALTEYAATRTMAPQLTRIAIAPTPTPYVPAQPPPLISFEVIGSLGLGCLIGLIAGLALGVVVGITIKQRD